MVTFPGKEPPGIVFSKSVKVSSSVNDISRTFHSAVKKGFKALSKDIDKIRLPIGFEGMVLSIKVDDLDQMAGTINNWGTELLRKTRNGTAGYIMDIVASGSDSVDRDVFDSIGESAAEHMRRMAYKLPKERRGGPARQHVFGKSAREPFKGRMDPKTGQILYTRGTDKGEPKLFPDIRRETYLVALRDIDPRQYRTKHLEKSIWYKLIHKHKGKSLDSYAKKHMNEELRKRIEQRQRLVTEVLIGPGAGNTPAPQYAWIVNAGAGPVKGMFYIPRFKKVIKSSRGVEGRMSQLERGRSRNRGGGGAHHTKRWWGGFEGKHYLEETAQWLIRETPRMQLSAAKFARIYLKKAIRQHSRMWGAIQISDANIKAMEHLAETWLLESTSMSTKQMMFQLSAELVNFAEKI